MTHTGRELAECALLPKWDKYTYDKLDCQAFVEECLKEIGVRKSNGTVYNWKGSNSMYRNYFSWRGTVEECIKEFGTIPLGAFVYMWKESGEKELGYNDGLGNCSHVGIYCGNDLVRDSTRTTRKPFRNGVGSRDMTGFNRVTLFSGIDYSCITSYNSSVNGLIGQITEVRTILNKMEGILNELLRS